jgi:hypothetical protein
MSFPRVALGEVLPGQSIDSEDWLAISLRSDWLYKSQVEIVPGFMDQITYVGGGALTIVTTTGRVLSSWFPAFFRHRPLVPSCNVYVYGIYYTWRTQRRNLTSTALSTPQATTTNTNSTGAGGWTVQTMALNPTITSMQVADIAWNSTNPGVDTAEVIGFALLGRFALS